MDSLSRLSFCRKTPETDFLPVFSNSSSPFFADFHKINTRKFGCRDFPFSRKAGMRVKNRFFIGPTGGEIQQCKFTKDSNCTSIICPGGENFGLIRPKVELASLNFDVSPPFIARNRDTLINTKNAVWWFVHVTNVAIPMDKPQIAPSVIGSVVVGVVNHGLKPLPEPHQKSMHSNGADLFIGCCNVSAGIQVPAEGRHQFVICRIHNGDNVSQVNRYPTIIPNGALVWPECREPLKTLNPRSSHFIPPHKHVALVAPVNLTMRRAALREVA